MQRHEEFFRLLQSGTLPKPPGSSSVTAMAKWYDELEKLGGHEFAKLAQVTWAFVAGTKGPCDWLHALRRFFSALGDKPRLIVLIHGIRTHAAWQERLRSLIRQHDPTSKVVPLKYGYFDVLSFLCPLFTRQGPLRRITAELRSAIANHQDHELVVIAHSFGTYLVAEAFRRDEELRVARLLLCGSVIEPNYEWNARKRQLMEQEVLNEVGTRDVWPVLATTATWGFGPSGTFGFGSANVRDRFHDGGHSDFFNTDFMEKFWVPFVLKGTIEEPRVEASRPEVPFWLSLLSVVHVKYMVVVCFALFCYVVCRWA